MNKRIRWSVPTVVVASAMASVLTAGVAWAAPTKTIFDAGYWVLNAPATSAASQFVVPTVHCTAGQNAGVGMTTEVHDEPGTHVALTSVRTECIHGVATYQAKFNINTTISFPVLTVLPRNVMSESVTQNASGTRATISDLTTHRTVTATGAGNATDNHTAVLVNWLPNSATPPTPQPVPNFGRITFTNVVVNGTALKAHTLMKDDMFAGTTDPPAKHADKLVTTGAVSHMNQFTCTFRRSS